ncbi:phytoene synthase [Exophiala viscosa]|uniref:phytoene synthase n=1 Tax=Exophiala viscosa TaxID=2486360 RepID=UPI00219FCDBE|nr:phytoene synthase [Exophiala viscosa]
MYDYALVHVVFTIPWAIALSIILGPLLTRRDVYKICFLQLIAVSYTIPWDSYLIRTKVWSYPPDVIIGPTLLDIPAEEVFFFVIQTYITTCLQILLSKSVVTATYLHNEADPQDAVGRSLRPWKYAGQVIFTLCSVVPLFFGGGHAQGTYMRLIIAWASPVLLMLWIFAYQLLLTLPWTTTLLPIAAPTLYLWIVDTIALHRGTWSIELGTKLGIHVWPHLEIEEAVFFLITNMLIVWGSTAFDNAMAILDAFPAHFPVVPGMPSPILLLKGLFMSTAKYDSARLAGLNTALTVLAKKSRSFYLASGVFSGRLRIDLILLYAFCRVADDLIDDAPSAKEADMWVKHFSHFLDTVFSSKCDRENVDQALAPFPAEARSILVLLPSDKLKSAPLYSLLDGFRIDQRFFSEGSNENPPIKTFADLERYASCVAATIGELCLCLIYQHDPDQAASADTKRKCLTAGAEMGRALQYINIVRDVNTDARVGRCYIPKEWFHQSALSSPEAEEKEILRHRKRILEISFKMYAENRDAIEDLPLYARSGIRVAVESYMEIGRVMRERMQQGKALDFVGGGKSGRASVPKSRRIWVGWKTMAGWRGSA